MILTRRALIPLAALLVVCAIPCPLWAQMAILEIYCPVCGYRKHFIQGVRPEDHGKNVQAHHRSVRTIQTDTQHRYPYRSRTACQRRAASRSPIRNREFGSAR